MQCFRYTERIDKPHELLVVSFFLWELGQWEFCIDTALCSPSERGAPKTRHCWTVMKLLFHKSVFTSHMLFIL